eukprot:5024123-Pyramimonas_sp.AAC.1
MEQRCSSSLVDLTATTTIMPNSVAASSALVGPSSASDARSLSSAPKPPTANRRSSRLVSPAGGFVLIATSCLQVYRRS